MRSLFENERAALLTQGFSSDIYQHKLYCLQKKYFGKYDDFLNRNREGPQWLQVDSVAEIVNEKIIEFSKTKFELTVFSILPNHVHIVILPDENLKVSPSNKKGKTKKYIVADIMRLLKGSTAREANILLERTGQFWHHESYDHVVRDEDELNKIIKYILTDPVRAGFVSHWSEWKWSYSLYDFSTT